jgi:hypothetical protein
MSKTKKPTPLQQGVRKTHGGLRRYKVEQVLRREFQPRRDWKSGLEWRIKEDD